MSLGSSRWQAAHFDERMGRAWIVACSSGDWAAKALAVRAKRRIRRFIQKVIFEVVGLPGPFIEQNMAGYLNKTWRVMTKNCPTAYFCSSDRRNSATLGLFSSGAQRAKFLSVVGS